MNNLVYVMAAYAIIWIALFIYIFSLGQKQKKLSNAIDSLKKSLTED